MCLAPILFLIPPGSSFLVQFLLPLVLLWALCHEMSSPMEDEAKEGNAPKVQPLMYVSLVLDLVNVLREAPSETPFN